MTIVYVPGDSAARSVGADQVAIEIASQANARGLDVQIVRNGSRGALFLEPLVEVLTSSGRIAFGPVSADEINSLFEADFLNGGDHVLALGKSDEIAWLAKQDRVTFARVGIIDPLSISDYESHGGLTGLRKALDMKSEDIVEQVTASGLRGRGGAGFPAGVKWRTVLNTVGEKKYICCNADEGDSGTFADRMVMEGDPFMLLEGMTIAGIAVGATEGVIYIRSEYPDAIEMMKKAIVLANEFGSLGETNGDQQRSHSGNGSSGDVGRSRCI